MKNLFQFIFKNIHWLLFCLFVYLSVFLIVKNNQFQRSKYLQTAREVTGYVYSVANYFYSYFHMRSVNTDLTRRIMQLEAEVRAYQRQSGVLQSNLEPVHIFGLDPLIYDLIPARVVNNSVLHLENYLTLNKGSDDGIQPDMGVISIDGVIGVIVDTSPRFSTAISLLNTKYKPSGTIQRNNYFGPLVWNGKDTQYTYLTEIPRHVESEIQRGDTVITSGHSAVFPKGIPVGSIVDWEKQRDDNYISIRIRLFTNFNRLNDVLIVANRFQKEQKELEERTFNLRTTR